MIHQRNNLDRHLFTLADHRHAKQPPDLFRYDHLNHTGYLLQLREPGTTATPINDKVVRGKVEKPAKYAQSLQL